MTNSDSLFTFVEKQLRIFGVNIWDFSPLKLMRLGVVVVLVFSLSFGPFIAMVWLLITWHNRQNINLLMVSL